jgi:hypothetical protein
VGQRRAWAGREAEVKENSAGRSRARRRPTETSPRRHVLLFRHLALRAALTHRAIIAPYYFSQIEMYISSIKIC